MSELAHLTLDEALAIHDSVIDRYGGHAGIRDLGLLECAVSPSERVLAEAAAALYESLMMSHPFVDGDRRGPPTDPA